MEIVICINFSNILSNFDKSEIGQKLQNLVLGNYYFASLVCLLKLFVRNSSKHDNNSSHFKQYQA